jgi:RimJ/RimL family protein N-acetyltransferase
MAASDARPRQVRLVPYDDRFLEASFVWLNDPEITRLVRGKPFTLAAQRDWYDGLRVRFDYRIWGIEVDGQPVGATGLKNITDAEAELFIYIGERTAWGAGVGETATRALLDLAPEHLSRVWLEVGDDNPRAHRLYERLGFSVCGRRDDITIMERRQP